jgi:hypothetical protein
MQIKRLILRQQQTSILNEEISEVLAIFEVEFLCCKASGTAVLGTTYHKRDGEQTLHVSSNLVPAFKKNSDLLFQLDEAVWSMTPQATEAQEADRINLQQGLEEVQQLVRM